MYYVPWEYDITSSCLKELLLTAVVFRQAVILGTTND